MTGRSTTFDNYSAVIPPEPWQHGALMIVPPIRFISAMLMLSARAVTRSASRPYKRCAVFSVALGSHGKVK
jgi:hypothetical protein